MSTFFTQIWYTIVITKIMIIGFDGSRAFISKKTGTENYSYQLLKSLAKIDKKNHYLVFLRPNINPGKDWPENFTFKTIEWGRLWTQAGLGLETFRNKMDVLFVPAHTLPLIRKPGLKTVVTVHDLGSEYLPSMHQLKQKLYLDLMQKYQLKTASKIISVSKATKVDLVKRIGIEKEKIEVVYEGYDQELFKPVAGDALVNKQSLKTSDAEVYSLRQFNLEPKKYFLFVGTVQPRKNLERVMRAFAQVVACGSEDIRLVIAGSKGWLSDRIYQLPKELGIEERVKFLGYVEDKDLPFLYSGAKAFFFPSLFEGFGLPIIEAQACEVPVLTSNISSMPEIAGDAAILVDPYDIDSIKKGMLKITDQQVAKEVTKKGFENIRRFSWEKCAEQTLRVLTNL